MASGAVKLWGKVGEVEAPYIVLPITIEPSKPRLCIDARYPNLWMKDTPFSLDKLVDVPRFLYQDSFMSKIDISPAMTMFSFQRVRQGILALSGTVIGGCALLFPSDGKIILTCIRP